MSPFDVAHHLCTTFDDFAERAIRPDGPNNWNGLRDDLFAWISNLDTGVAFDGLFHVLETQTRYQYQWLAGDLLQRASIPCPLTLDDFITRVAPRFNASADTVPKYLGATFGKNAVLTRLRDLRSTENDSHWVSALDSMRYGLGEYPAQS